VSREFIARNSDGSARAVADLSHFSDHYDSIMTKAETLEGFSASLLPGDHLLSMDLRSGYHHFRFHPDMRKYFTVRVVMADGVERYFQYLVLPFGWSRSGFWFCRLVQRFWMMVKKTLGYRVLSYVDDLAIAPSLGRAATAADCRKASRRLDELLRRYGLTRHPLKGVWGAGSQCLQYLGFMIDTHRGLFGVPAAKLDAISGMARQMLTRARRNRRLVRADVLESFIGKAQSLRLVVPDTAFRLRALYDCVPSRGADGAHSNFIGRRFQVTPTTRISHLGLRDLQFWRDLPSEAAPPPYLAKGAHAECYGSHRRVDVGLWSGTVPRGARG
jgi:Reverse transcriptase (RNA-dependent DNA polymerase)